VDDGLPQRICNTCATKITDWYNFKIIAKLSDDSLHKMVADNTTIGEVGILKGPNGFQIHTIILVPIHNNYFKF